MKINRENIKVEMTSKEYMDLVFCLRESLENAHISFLSAEKRGIERFVETCESKFKRNLECYENISGKTYDIYEQEMKLLDRLPSLKRF